MEEPAFDGTRSVLVSEFDDDRAVLVLDADRFVVDNISVTEFDELRESGRASQELLDFLVRRAEVGDPLFANAVEEFGISMGGDR